MHGHGVSTSPDGESYKGQYYRESGAHNLKVIAREARCEDLTLFFSHVPIAFDLIRMSCGRGLAARERHLYI
jgi:hypothetical protein